MMQGTKRLSEKGNSIQEFTVLFWEDHVLIDGKSIPLGQISTEVLNYPDEQLLALREKLNTLLQCIQTKLMNPDVQKTFSLVNETQEKLNSVLCDIFSLPLFSFLDMDREKAESMLITAFSQFPDEFQKMVTSGTAEQAIFMEYVFKLVSIPDELHSFKAYTSVLLDFYMERLKLRNPESYAVGVYDFFSNTELLNEIASSLPPCPFQFYRQTCGVMLEFTTMPHPEQKERYILAERMVFHRLGEFLHTDFFRGLMHGHTPRRCHNCGSFFLLTEGYDTRNCNRIAPAEKTRTCREIGAHHKEKAKKESRTPAKQEYDRVYNRLKTRKNRGKISAGEWNELVAKAWELRRQNEAGELSDEEYRKNMKKL